MSQRPPGLLQKPVGVATAWPGRVGVPKLLPDRCASTLLCTFMMCAVGPVSDR